MKKLVYSSLFVVSMISFFIPAAHACPDLRGIYECQQNSYRTLTDYTFDQVLEAGIWKFTMIAQPANKPPMSRVQFTADKTERDVIDQISGQKLAMTASCDSTTLKVEGRTRLPNGTPIYFAENLSRLPNGDLRNISLDINGNWIDEVCQQK